MNIAHIHISRYSSNSQTYNELLQSMKATFARRPLLRSKWYFECRCSRCEDPRESGSLLSALLCSQPAPSANKTCGGLVLSSEPTSGDSDWQCESCDAKYDSQQVSGFLRHELFYL